MEFVEQMIRSYGLSHVGRVRQNNEDTFKIDRDLNLFVVADGMGGAQAGERASDLAVTTLIDEFRQAGAMAEPEDLAEAVRRANQAVRTDARRNPELAGMGTTVVAALVRPPRAYIVNVGDSRAYLLAQGVFQPVTKDHSWINEVGRGLGLSDEQLSRHPYRNVLTKAVGAEDDVEVQKIEIAFEEGDLLLLCSDGLHGVAGEAALAAAVARDVPLEQRCAELIEAALEQGAPDNVTALLIEYAAGTQDPY